jgi:hypothetical protein
MSNTPQGEASEGNAADDTLMVDQGGWHPLDGYQGQGRRRARIALDPARSVSYKSIVHPRLMKGGAP